MNDKKPVYPAVQIMRNSPAMAAAISKLEKAPHQNTVYNNGNRDIGSQTNPMLFTSVLSSRAKKNVDIASIFKLLPDLQLAKQILISCILSPKDMTSTELIYRVPKNLFNSDLTSSLTSKIKDYFDNEYDILQKLPMMLEDALFDKGSYPVAVLPENAIDDFINGNAVLSTEGFKTRNDLLSSKSIGILGNSKIQPSDKNIKVALENYSQYTPAVIDSRITISKEDLDLSSDIVLDYIEVTDNYNLLKLPKINKGIDKNQVKDRYSKYSTVSLESFDNLLKDQEIDKLIFRTRTHTSKQIEEIKGPENLSRKTVGNPLIMKLPSESIIPIYVPGDKTDHVGYFVMLTEDGHPVSTADGDLKLNALDNNAGNSNSISSGLIKRVNSNMCDGTNCFNGNDKRHIQEATRIYSEIIEKDLINRVRNGIYKTQLEIGKNEEIYRIMLARTLAKKFTKILYIPIEYVTYIAFDYDDTGIGKSLMDDTMTVNTLRVILMFNNLMASVKNSIGRTKVGVELPALDVNPEATLEKIMDEVVRSRSVSLPSSVSNPSDIIEWIQKAGYEWEISGNPRIPDLKISFDQTQSNYQKADTELEEGLKKSSISALGLTPETVDNGLSDAEFATVAVSNNILTNKRVLTYQEKFTPQLSDHLRKIAINTRSLVDDIKSIIESNYESIQFEIDEEIDENIKDKLDEDTKKRIIVTKAINDLLNGFYVELPKPSSVTMTQQLDEFNEYSDGLDKVLDAYMSSEIMTSITAGDISNDIDTLRAIVKAYFQRKYMSEKGIMTELADLTSTGEDGNPLFNMADITASHLDSLNKSGVITLEMLMSKVAEINKKLADASSAIDGASSDEGTDTPSEGDTSITGATEPPSDDGSTDKA